MKNFYEKMNFLEEIIQDFDKTDDFKEFKTIFKWRLEGVRNRLLKEKIFEVFDVKEFSKEQTEAIKAHDVIYFFTNCINTKEQEKLIRANISLITDILMFLNMKIFEEIKEEE